MHSVCFSIFLEPLWAYSNDDSQVSLVILSLTCFTMCLAKLEVSLTYVMTEFLSAGCVTPCTRLGCPSNLLYALRLAP